MGLDPISTVAGLADDVITRIWPDATEKEKEKLALVSQELSASVAEAQAQADTNKTEAANVNVFVAGWRPFVGWVCGSAFAWNFIGAPMMGYFGALFGHPVPVPHLDLGALQELLMGMLGLGGMRTFEKFKNVAGNH